MKITLLFVLIILQSCDKLPIGGGFCHLRQRFDDLLLRAVEILEFEDIQVFQCFEFHTGKSRVPTCVAVSSVIRRD